jgi:arylsulfatase A-like enzyme
MATQTRREFIKKMGLAGTYSLLAGCQGANRGARAATRQPNILFLFADDQRFDTIRALGNKETVTPNIDRLVREGTTFENAYIMGSMSGAVCMPSRAMLMSGKHLFDLTDKGKTIPPEHVMLPEVLRNAGYATFATGKWHNGRVPFARSFTTARKIFFGGMSDHYKVAVHDFDPAGKYSKEARYYDEGKHSSELFSDAAIEFLQKPKNDKPFFLYVSYTAPHDPRTAPKKYHDMYDAAKIGLPENFIREHPFDNGEMRIRDEKLAAWPRTPEAVRRHIADYYAMITHLDTQIGRVLEALERTGHHRDTVVVFSADNGLAVGRHGLMGKQNLYEHSAHVPLVITGPGIAKGRRCDGLCYLHDVYPTLCELVGVDIPDSVKSVSLVSLLDGRRSEVRETLFFAYKDVQRGIRNGRYKLIEYAVNGRRTTQLFDVANDPWELRNLASNAAYAGQLRRLRKELVKWKDKLGDDSRFWQGFGV